MNQPQISPYPISDFIEWDFAKQLVLSPHFQRGDVWPAKAKSYLIDTIIRNRPIPPLYIRLNYDPEKRKTIREVVDGQQRLRAVLGFLRGDFPILKEHNSKYEGKYFQELPDDIKSHIRAYKFGTYLLENISDQEVHDIFIRINTHTVRANPQELRNAKYFGAFKQAMYDMAINHYTFWIQNRILTERNVSRMGDAEYVSVLTASIIDGIRQTKKKDLDEFYIKFDDEFPKEREIKNRFSKTIDLIGELFEGELKNTEYRRKPVFYSLFIFLYDAKYGIPKSDWKQINLNQEKIQKIREKLFDLDKIMTSENPPKFAEDFVDATKLSTADTGKRRLRHKFLWEYVIEEKY